MNEIMLPPQDLDYIVAQRDGELSKQLWWQQVAAKWQQLSAYPKQQKWLLFAEDSFDFSCCLFALLLAEKTPVLAPNKQAETLAKLLPKVDGVCADVSLANAPVQLASASCELNESFELDELGDVPEELELHLYTSGSTGEPKLVVKRWRQLVAEVTTLERQFGSLLEHSLICTTVSHQHIYGLLFTVLWPVLARRCWRVKPLRYPEDYHALAEQPISLVSSPSFLAHLSLQTELAAKTPQFCVSSGGPLKPDTLERLLVLWQQAPHEVFGSSETGGVAYRNQREQAHWTPFYCIEWRMAAPSSALEIRSPYLLDPNAWHQMDDAVAAEADGFSLQGRLDRVVKIAEKRVCLEQMTGVLSSHPWVQHCDLFTLQSAREYIAAVVVLTETGKAALALGKFSLNQQLRQHLAGHFEAVTLPRRWRYVDQHLVNSQGKRQLQTMKELFQ